MRRVLTFLTAVVLLLASLGVGVFTADLPFWRRALAVAAGAGRALPTRRPTIGGAAPADRGAAGAAVVDRGRLALARRRHARAQRRLTRLASHARRRAVQIERAISAPTTTSTLMPAGLIARPLAAMAVGPRARRRTHRLARRRRSRATCTNGKTRRAADHAAPAARGHQRSRNRRRHRARCCAVRVGRSRAPAALRHRARACECC